MKGNESSLARPSIHFTCHHWAADEICETGEDHDYYDGECYALDRDGKIQHQERG